MESPRAAAPGPIPTFPPDAVRLGPRCGGIALLDKLLPSGPPSTGDDVTDEVRLAEADTGAEGGT